MHLTKTLVVTSLAAAGTPQPIVEKLNGADIAAGAAAVATSVHPAHAHVGRPKRYTADASPLAGIKEMELKTFHTYLKRHPAAFSR